MQCRKFLAPSGKCTQAAAEYRSAPWTSHPYRTAVSQPDWVGITRSPLRTSSCHRQRQATVAGVSCWRVRAHLSGHACPESGRLLPHSSPACKVSASRAESALRFLLDECIPASSGHFHQPPSDLRHRPLHSPRRHIRDTDRPAAASLLLTLHCVNDGSSRACAPRAATQGPRKCTAARSASAGCARLRSHKALAPPDARRSDGG